MDLIESGDFIHLLHGLSCSKAGLGEHTGEQVVGSPASS